MIEGATMRMERSGIVWLARGHRPRWPGECYLYFHPDEGRGMVLVVRADAWDDACRTGAFNENHPLSLVFVDGSVSCLLDGEGGSLDVSIPSVATQRSFA